MATILFALLSATLYGNADFLGGLASRRSTVMSVMIFSQLAGLITLFLVLPLLPSATATRADFAWGALAAGALGMGTDASLAAKKSVRCRTLQTS